MGGFKDIASGFTQSPKALARRTDPSTSHAAAAHMVESGKLGDQLQHVLELVRAHPDCTAAELADYSHLDRYQIQRRLSDLSDDDEGKVVPKVKGTETKRHCSKTGRAACTWRAA